MSHCIADITLQLLSYSILLSTFAQATHTHCGYAKGLLWAEVATFNFRLGRGELISSQIFIHYFEALSHIKTSATTTITTLI